MCENSSSTLFALKSFTSHSGLALDWKIDCDALTPGDLRCLSFIIVEHFKVVGRVVGVPQGGIPLANALWKYGSEGGKTLIVDDVLTTGMSMEKMRERHPGALGVVIFARGPCPDWVWPVFQLSD